ncbi:LysR family transcriptional regulator [Neomegalonema perideroedes]|uniref:LysR family transcriptional regulator n=1 Tax=Neomegalonema perideroedes TaxID=217219 RepID=UPI0003656FF4|nr:LysR family transcriptional regulator [Neomegalonema perideroedes]
MTYAEAFDWDNLRYFLAVARTGQLSAAARRLRTSHATVLRRIDRLEFGLKVRLFERSPRGYALTPMGRRFLETAESVEAETGRLQDEIAEGRSAQRGVVRFSAPEGFANHFFVELLPEFAARLPHVTLELVTIQQILSLSRKEADLAVGLEPPKGGPYLAEKLCDYSLRVYGSRRRLAEGPPIADRAALLDQPFVGYIEDMIFSPGLDYLGDVHKGLKARFQSSSLSAQLAAARCGIGLCVLPDFIAGDDPELVCVLGEEIMLSRSYWMVHHRDLRDSSRIRAVSGFLKEAVSARTSRFHRL